MISTPSKDLWDTLVELGKTPITLSFIKFLTVGILLISSFGQGWAKSPNSKDSTDLTLAVLSDSSGISAGTRGPTQVVMGNEAENFDKSESPARSPFDT